MKRFRGLGMLASIAFASTLTSAPLKSQQPDRAPNDISTAIAIVAQDLVNHATGYSGILIIDSVTRGRDVPATLPAAVAQAHGNQAKLSSWSEAIHCSSPLLNCSIEGNGSFVSLRKAVTMGQSAIVELRVEWIVPSTRRGNTVVSSTHRVTLTRDDQGWHAVKVEIISVT
jgi:hypothetical protein